MNLVRNERLKLLATYLNGLAIAAFAIGGFSQLAGTGSATPSTGFFVIAAWFAFSLALHIAAQLVLGTMRE